jgi:ParB family chromosome partitioning protein
MSRKWFPFFEREEEEGASSTDEEVVAVEEVEEDESIKLIGIDEIDTNPYQPRKTFSKKDLQELADSIAQYGVLQPIVVREAAEEGYELIVGERRLRAARLAGLEKIPTLIRDAESKDLAFLALVENLQRQDLDFLDEAQAYERLIKEFGMTQREVAERVGKGQSTVANKLRVLRLPSKVKQAVKEGGLTERHARSLLLLESEEAQLSVTKEIAERELSVREADELVKRRAEEGQKGQQDERGQQYVKVYKDLRIFLNSFRDLVNKLNEVGIDAKLEQEESEEEMIIRVRIPQKEAEEASE